MLCRRILPVLFAAAAFAAPPDGAALYKARCAMCHDASPAQPRTPTHADLASRTPDTIVKAMFEGIMVPQSSGLNPDEGRAIATFLTGKEIATAPATIMAGQCPAPPKPLVTGKNDWNGWGNGLENTRFQPKPGFTTADIPKLKLKWAFAFPGETMANAQPVTVGGRVFIGTSRGVVYSLDAATGCWYWTYNANASVRNAVSIGKVGSRTMVFFGDAKAFTHAIDADTGAPIWKVKIEDFQQAKVTGSVVFYNGRVYVPIADLEEPSAMSAGYECCKYRGSITSLDAATGKTIWKSYTIAEEAKPYKKGSTGTQLYGPAGASVWSAPTIDTKRKLVYAATGNSFTSVEIPTSDAVIAFDLETGKLAWTRQVDTGDNFTMACGAGRSGPNCPDPAGPDTDFGTSPALVTVAGKQMLVVGQKSGVLWGLDPDDKGEVLWHAQVGKGGPLGGIEWGHAVDGTIAYAPISDRFQKDAKGLISGVDLKTGRILWTTDTPDTGCKPGTPGCQTAISAAVSAIPGAVFAGAVDGHMRAYDSKTGAIVWDYDANHAFDTVNKVPGKGGSFDAPGPVIVNGMLLTASGYSMWGGAGGNVLLAFSVDGK